MSTGDANDGSSEQQKIHQRASTLNRKHDLDVERVLHTTQENTTQIRKQVKACQRVGCKVDFKPIKMHRNFAVSVLQQAAFLDSITGKQGQCHKRQRLPTARPRPHLCYRTYTGNMQCIQHPVKRTGRPNHCTLIVETLEQTLKSSRCCSTIC